MVLSHRIREAMMLGNWTDQKMTGAVEADETYIGGKYNKRVKRAEYDKAAFFGVVEAYRRRQSMADRTGD